MPTARKAIPIRRQDRDAERTRERLVEAAQQVFSYKGYVEARLRDIAQLAGVNVSLVNRYFGSKEGLFEEALKGLLGDKFLTRWPRDTFGKQLVSALLDTSAALPQNPLPLLVYSASDAEARQISLRLLHEGVLIPLASWFGTEDGEERASRVMALTIGFFTYRLVLPLASFSGEVSLSTRRWLEESLQAIVDN